MKVEEIESTLQSENESAIQEKIILKICKHFESLYIFTLEKTVYVIFAWFLNTDWKTCFKVAWLDSIKHQLKSYV